MDRLTAVGLGPGDPELVTLKGLRALQSALLIFVPRSRDGEQSLALRIAEPYIDRTRQQVVELPLPMTRNIYDLMQAWQAAAACMIASMAQVRAAHGLHPEDELRSAYLLLGDPLLYGTFTYIQEQLQESYPKIAIEIVPGVTSFAAAAALALQPLATTSDRVAIVPASYETDAGALRRLLSGFDTVVLMKAGPVLPHLLVALKELNILDSALYAERVGMPEERIISDLRTLPLEPTPYLSLLIVKGKRD